MKKIILAALMLVGAYSANAQVDLGADIVSSYVWRGASGGGAAVQPWVSYTAGDLEIGAWGNYSLNDTAGDAELDFYATYSIGGVAATLTHYNEGDQAYSSHPFDKRGLEGTLSGEIAGISLTGAYWFGADDPATYIEAGYALGGFDLAIGAGNTELYTGEGDFGLCNISLGYAKDSLFGQLVYNPDADAMFMVVGISL